LEVVGVVCCWVVVLGVVGVVVCVVALVGVVGVVPVVVVVGSGHFSDRTLVPAGSGWPLGSLSSEVG
jgi:hypothetical protein